MYFYQNGMKYGPFDQQEDGYPHAGQVVRYFRKRNRIPAAELATKLGYKSERYIYKMEQKNRVSDSITRRRFIASFLSIPPILLGLSDTSQLSLLAPTLPPIKSSVDVASYTDLLHVLWSSFHIGVNQQTLEGQTDHAIYALSNTLNPDTKTLLSRYYRLQSRLAREHRNLLQALSNIETAQAISKEIDNSRLHAVNLLTHGRILVENDNPKDAVKFFEASLAITKDEKTSQSGTTAIELSMALSSQVQDNVDRKRIEYLIDRAGKIAYENVPEDASFTVLNSGIFHTYAALSYADMNMTTKALTHIEEATEQLPANQVRRIALTDIVQAKIYFQAGEIYQSLSCIERAYIYSVQVNSIYNIHLIRKLVQEINDSSFGKMKEIQNQLKHILKQYQ